MMIDVKFSVGLLLGAVLVYVYWQYCERKRGM